MLDALILAILPNLSTAFLQDQHRSDRPATEAPLNVERRELAAIQLLLGAERKYSEAKERLVALETRLAGRTEADARSLLAEVQTLLENVRRALGESAQADAGQGKIDEAVAAALAKKDFAFVRALGKRAVPGLLAAVRSNVEFFPSNGDQDPLVLLAEIDALAVDQLAGELFREPSFFWKRRIARVLSSILANRPELWDASAAQLRASGLLQTAERLVGDPDVGEKAFEFLAALCQHGQTSPRLVESLLGELRSGDAQRLNHAKQWVDSWVEKLEPEPFALLLAEPDARVREFAARTLLHSFPTDDTLLEHARDPSVEIRRMVVDYLERHESTARQVTVLEGLLQDEDEHVRFSACSFVARSKAVTISFELPAEDTFSGKPLSVAQLLFEKPLPESVYRLLLKGDEVARATLAGFARVLPTRLAFELLGILAADPSPNVVAALVTGISNEPNFALRSPAQALEIAGTLFENPSWNRKSTNDLFRFLFSLQSSRKGFDALVRWALARPDPAVLVELARDDDRRRLLLSLDPELACACVVRLFREDQERITVAIEEKALFHRRPELAPALTRLAADGGQPVHLRLLALAAAIQQGSPTEEHERIAQDCLRATDWQDAERSKEAAAFFRSLLQRKGAAFERFTNRTILAALRQGDAPPALVASLATTAHYDEEGALEIAQLLKPHLGEDGWQEALWQLVLAMQNAQLADPEFLKKAAREPHLLAAAFRTIKALADSQYLPLLAEVVAHSNDSFKLEQASRALTGYLDEGAVEPLLTAATRVSDVELRDAILAHLEKIREYTAAKERWATRQAKAQTREQVIAALLEQLASGTDEVRVQAIRALATWEAVETMPRLIELTRAQSKDVSAAARAALDRLNAPKGD